MTTCHCVDWARPVSYKGMPTEVLRILDNGAAVLLVEGRNVGYFAVVQRPESEYVRNVPPPAPEWAAPGLKLELGKYYRTRSGRKVQIVRFKGEDLSTGEPKLFPYGCDDNECRTIHGTVWQKQGPADGDFVAEWPALEPFELWINHYEGTGGDGAHASRAAADKYVAFGRVCLIHLSYDGNKLEAKVIE